jgi:hypothetical protein
MKPMPWILLGGLLFGAGELRAQWAISPRGVGMGNTGVVTESGIFGLFSNPANLGWSDRAGRLMLALGTLSGGLDADLFPKAVYDRYFTRGESIGPDQAEEVLARWFGSRTEQSLYAEGGLMPIGIGLRGEKLSVGLALRSRVLFLQQMSRGWLDLLLRGTSPDRELPLDARSQLWHYTEAVLGISVPLWRHENGALYLGVAPRLVWSMTYGEGQVRSTLAITAGGEEILHRYRIEVRTAGELTRRWNALLDDRPAPEGWKPLQSTGSGWGGSVGLAYRGGGWTFGVALNDLGRVRINREAQQSTNRKGQFLYQGMRIDPDVLKARFQNDLGEYLRAFWEDSILGTHYRDFDRQSGSFSVSLPTHLQFGLARQLARSLQVNAAFSMGLEDMAPPAALGLGLEYRLGSERFFFPLRAGVQLGGHVPWSVTAGVGLVNSRFLDLDWALLLHPGADAGYRVRLALGMITLRF